MKSPETYLLPYASISWQDSDTPFARDYDDVYWSAAGGLAEKQHVFLTGCDLAQRWNLLQDGDRFTILETGFGFGLNFLLTLRAWNACSRSSSARLDYIAFEKHLVRPEDLQRMASNFGLEPELDQLIQQYPLPVPGNHCIWLSATVCLHLMVGDIHDQMQDLEAKVDAVFLDGFSPGLNAEMWNETLMTRLCSLLRPGARLSSYSVAGALRRSLAAGGLTVHKLKGFGTKRHMLLAEQSGDWQPDSSQRLDVVVVGAGLSGLLCADALEKRGHRVTVIDQNSEPLGALRQINQIAIYPKLSKTPQPYSNFYLRAFLYFLRHHSLNACGRIELLDSDDKQAYGAAIAAQLPGFAELIDPATAGLALALKVESPALRLKSAGRIAPKTLVTNRDVLQGMVRSIEYKDNSWYLNMAEREEHKASIVVLATGHESLPQLAPLALISLRGQSLRIQGLDIAPEAVFSAKKTWFPISEGSTTVSGTYDRFDDNLTPRQADTELLLEALSPYLPLSSDKPSPTAGVGIRSATRDRMPVVGQLPDWDKLEAYCQQAPVLRNTFKSFAPGLYCSVGFGSHGGTLGPYCAELLTRKISGDSVGEDMSQITSTRFMFRDAGIKPS